MAESAFDNILGWLHQGYPQGVPQHDYFALLALLARTLTEDEVVRVAQIVLKGTDSDTVTPEEIRAAIHVVTDKEPNPKRSTRSRPGWRRSAGRWRRRRARWAFSRGCRGAAGGPRAPRRRSA